MTTRDNLLYFILHSFPKYNHIIEELYQESDSFRSLCQDYYECLQVLGRLKTSQAMISKGYDKEYRKLAKELEDEIRKRLK